jgi:hypothetical protein
MSGLKPIMAKAGRSSKNLGGWNRRAWRMAGVTRGARGRPKS